MATPSEGTKPIHTIVLDAGPIIKNNPPVSTLLKQAAELVTTPSVISEIRDPATRSRVETQLLPFISQRTPKAASLKFVAEFARKTGDRSVLSREDLEIIALAYDLECERNGGDWRLRREPGQKTINGAPPMKEDKVQVTGEEKKKEEEEGNRSVAAVTEQVKDMKIDYTNEPQQDEAKPADQPATTTTTTTAAAAAAAAADETTAADDTDNDDEDDDGGEWITPTNIKKHQIKDADLLGEEPESRIMQAAVITSDFAMQNVILQMNLNLLSNANMQRIKTLKSYVLRCHACFFTSKDMSKQFCPRCGKPTLNRVSCTTSADGTFKIHLKKNMQWNHRGDRFSIPKATAGSAGQRIEGGGKGGWGHELILAPDQKEYTRALKQEYWRNKKEHDLMDTDYLPGILSGQRAKGGGRVKIGAGRNVNSRKRHA
ncbi:Nin1 binding protein [Ascosphaera aggregata]|nr:Nin1 binding protein [Ascosphaera aggregata]